MPRISIIPAQSQLNQELFKTPVLDSTMSVHSRRAALGLAAFSFSVRLKAERPPASEGEDKDLMGPALSQGAGLLQGEEQSCVHNRNWLTLDQAERLISAPDQSKIRGRRDRAVLAVMVNCGLRRREVSELEIEEIQQCGEHWAIIDMKSKRKRVRTVPLPACTKLAIDHWTDAAQIKAGNVFRPMNHRGDVLDAALPPQNVLVLVSHYGKQIGVAHLTPNDLRRTFAKLAHEGNAPLAKIQVFLGHASIQTTARYLGVRQDLRNALMPPGVS